MSKLILVSNRLPIKLTEVEGTITLTPGDGGLATALRSVFKSGQACWVGSLGSGASPEMIAEARSQRYYPVTMPPELYRRYYEGFSNRILWPVLHGLAATVRPGSYWQNYRAANEKFADTVAELTRPGDIIWVHDYHLLLLPKLLRSRGLTNRIGFFLHTPFFRMPFFTRSSIGRELLSSLLTADTLGVQTKATLTQLRSALEQLGARLSEHTNEIQYRGRRLIAEAFPIGIDFRSYARRPLPEPAFYENLNPSEPAPKTILSLSRLDYTKGILQQLEAVSRLAAQPHLAGTFTFSLMVVPSREQIPEYARLKAAIEHRVGQINATATSTWQPVAYHYGQLDPEALRRTYRQADIMLVTPIADGMNLVAKEYLAANSRGTLILSATAGAAEQLTDTILVDPHDPGEIAAKIEQALKEPAPRSLTRRLRKIIKTQDVHHWAGSFLAALRKA